MKFFHVYNDKYFAGLEKNNLINEDTGFKIQHVFSLEEDMKFNRYAAKGTKLYHYIKENRFPFYVDRIAGGVTYHEYEFDKSLIEEYRSLLDGWFLGFQQHETSGNRRLDWQRVYERMKGEAGPYDVEELKKRSVRSYAVTPDGKTLYGFSQGSPEDYAAFPYPATFEALMADYRRLFRQRMEATDGAILPCDSFQLLTHLQNELGIQNFMPEVGSQIPHMRMAVALARGTALAEGKKWGVYYETWRSIKTLGATMPCFNKEPGNEWYLTQETHRDDFTTYGPNGGSSRLLQKRIFYYALMSGTMFFGEEWGLNCSYLEMHGDFPLSPYGLVKKEVIDFARDHRKVKAKIPFAVVLPKEFPFLQLSKVISPVGEWKGALLGRDLSESEKEMFGRVEDVLKLIFQREAANVYGNEGHVLQNSRFGDLFDLVYEDAPKHAFSKYDLLIDPSKDSRIAKENPSLPFVCYTVGKAEELARVIEEKAKEALPLTCDRFLWLLSEDENGSYLSVFNNEGNERNVEWGDRALHEADGVVKISLKEKTALSLLRASSPDVRLERADEKNYSLFLPANDLAILKLN